MATGAKLIINGFISKTIKLRRGVKQGDALSLFLFLVALEPLILAINLHPLITGIRTPGGHEQKTLCYADDLNLTLNNKLSLHPVMKLIHDFGLATGLRVQPAGHSKCCTCLVVVPSLDLDLSELPQNLKYIRNGIEILGTAVGNDSFVEDFMGKKVQIYETETKRLREYTQSYSERVVIANSKLLPQISYNTQFHGISDHYKDKINKISKAFMLKSSATKKQYFKSTRTAEYGGFGFPHITKNSESLILKQAFKYVKYRLENIPLDTEIGFVESNLGHFISRLCEFPVVNIRHTYPPNYFYQRIKSFITYYEITKEELIAGSVKPIRDRIRNGTTKPPDRQITHPFRSFPKITPNETMNTIQSHKIIAFNYKMHNKLLPFPSLREQWGIHGSANCTLCDRHRETEPHLFFYCDKVIPVWNVLGTIANRNFQYSEVVRSEFGEGIENREAMIFLTSITNFKIWSHRNAIKFGNQSQFSITGILKDLLHTIQDRSRFEGTRPREPFRTQLLDLLLKYQRFAIQWRIIPDEGIT